MASSCQQKLIAPVRCDILIDLAALICPRALLFPSGNDLHLPFSHSPDPCRPSVSSDHRPHSPQLLRTDRRAPLSFSHPSSASSKTALLVARILSCSWLHYGSRQSSGTATACLPACPYARVCSPLPVWRSSSWFGAFPQGTLRPKTPACYCHVRALVSISRCARFCVV